MKGTRLLLGLFVLALTPATALAQAGVTRLLTGPIALAQRQMEVRGYLSIEEEIEFFGVFRRGVGGNIDFGARAGYTDAAEGGFHIGGDLRYQLPSADMDVQFAVVGGLQATFADLANGIFVPIGVSIGADVGNVERSVMLYGLPFLEIDRIDPDAGDSDTEIEFGVELGTHVEITPNWLGSAGLSISSHDDDEVHLALGVIWRQ